MDENANFGPGDTEYETEVVPAQNALDALWGPFDQLNDQLAALQNRVDDIEGRLDTRSAADALTAESERTKDEETRL